MMEIPSDIKGLEKSITSSLTKVIVRGATAISAFWGRKVFVTIVVNPEQRNAKQESNGEPGSGLICLLNTITLG